MSENRLLPPATEHEIETMTAIQNLANTVIANAASRSLARCVVISCVTYILLTRTKIYLDFIHARIHDSYSHLLTCSTELFT